jgi:hypothetical protein
MPLHHNIKEKIKKNISKVCDAAAERFWCNGMMILTKTSIETLDDII